VCPRSVQDMVAKGTPNSSPAIKFSSVGSLDSLCGLVVRVPGYRSEKYCDSCEVRNEFMYVIWKKVDRLCGLVVRVPGYRTEMYCVSCEVRN
jgi:hypothetical protein